MRPLAEIIAEARANLAGGRPTLTDLEWERIFEAAESHEPRVNQLLETNNRLLDRARKAEAEAKALEGALLSAATVGARLVEIAARSR